MDTVLGSSWTAGGGWLEDSVAENREVSLYRFNALEKGFCNPRPLWQQETLERRFANGLIASLPAILQKENLLLSKRELEAKIRSVPLR